MGIKVLLGSFIQISLKRFLVHRYLIIILDLMSQHTGMEKLKPWKLILLMSLISLEDGDKYLFPPFLEK